MGCDGKYNIYKIGIWESKSNAEMLSYVKDKMEEKIALKDILASLLDELIAPETS